MFLFSFSFSLIVFSTLSDVAAGAMKIISRLSELRVAAEEGDSRFWPFVSSQTKTRQLTYFEVFGTFNLLLMFLLRVRTRERDFQLLPVCFIGLHQAVLGFTPSGKKEDLCGSRRKHSFLRVYQLK